MQNLIIKGTFISNGTLVIPAGHSIRQLDIIETANAAVTGGIKVGTTDGGIDVVVALPVAGLSLQSVLDATLLKRVFSLTSNTTLHVQTVTLWNGASVNVYAHLNRLIP